MRSLRDSNLANTGGDELRNTAGVFGIFAPALPVSYLAYDALSALQHRGHEIAGIAVSDGESVNVFRDKGLVSSIFDENNLKPLRGDLAIGQVGGSKNHTITWRDAQPVYRPGPLTLGFALGHNGSLTNRDALASLAGISPAAITDDADLIAELLANHAKNNASSEFLVEALRDVLPRVEGAYSLVLIDTVHAIAIRDPNGFRPLCLGRLDNGWAIASESSALDAIGAHFVREIEPGEMVIVEESGIRSERPFVSESVEPKLCLMEHVSLARSDAQLYGRETYGARRRMGELLAGQSPLPPSDRHFDRPVMVMGVPESGLAAAEGYAFESGIPLGQGFVKSRYIGRTFIAPEREPRTHTELRDFNPLREHVVGRRLIVVDDAVVRGTTTRALVNVLRAAGAVEVHLRVTSPPIKWPCFYGVETGTRAELLAVNLDLEEMRNYIGVDSLGFLSLSNLKEAIGAPGAGFCDACFTGSYPTNVPISFIRQGSAASDEVAQL